MKYILVLLFFMGNGGGFASSGAALPAEWREALTLLKDQKSYEAADVFEKLLETHPFSRPVRYNLALARYQQGRTGLALAGWRELLWEDSLDLRTWRTLKNTQREVVSLSSLNRQMWWLFVPPDLFLALVALSAGMGLFLLYKNRYRALRLWCIPGFLTLGLSGYYFWARHSSYVTLIQDGQILNAPHPEALPLVSQNEGAFLRVKNIKKGWIQVALPAFQRGWISTETALLLKKRTRLSPLSSAQ